MNYPKDSSTFEAKVGNSKFVKVLSLVFWAPGLWLLCRLIKQQLNSQNSAPIINIIAVYIFAFSFVAVGLAMLGWFKKCRVNTFDNSIERFWGILIPLCRQVEPLKKYTHIEVCKERQVVSSSNDTTRINVVFPVRLTNTYRDRELILKPENLLEARKISEGLCHLLQIPIIDTTAGMKQIREVDEIDLSIKEMIDKYDVEIPKPDIPTSMKRTVKEPSSKASQYTISLERPYKNNSRAFSIYIFLYIICIALLLIVGVDALSFMSVIIIYFIVKQSRELISSLSISTLKISPETIFYESRFLWSKHQKVNLNELEHLQVVGSDSKLSLGYLALITDDKIFSLAHGQKTSELEFIVELIKYTVMKGREA